MFALSWNLFACLLSSIIVSRSVSPSSITKQQTGLADKRNAHKEITMLLCALSALTFLLYALSSSSWFPLAALFPYYFLVRLLFSVFMSPMMPLLDTMALMALEATG